MTATSVLESLARASASGGSWADSDLSRRTFGTTKIAEPQQTLPDPKPTSLISSSLARYDLNASPEDHIGT
jgi:hypothetical protein